MALKAVVDSLDAVDEADRKHYEKDEASGKFVSQVSDLEQHPAIAGLKSALGKERTARTENERKAATLETAIADLKKQIEQKDQKGQDTTDLEKRLAKREAELRAEYEPRVKELDQIKGQLLKRERQDQTRQAAKDAKILPERYDDAMLAAQPYLDFRDGKLIVLDADGDPSSITPEKFFKEKFREMKPWYFEGSNTSGSGAKGGDALPAGMVTLTAAEAQNFQTYSEALKKVNGDHSKIKVAG